MDLIVTRMKVGWLRIIVMTVEVTERFIFKSMCHSVCGNLLGKVFHFCFGALVFSPRNMIFLAYLFFFYSLSTPPPPQRSCPTTISQHVRDMLGKSN